MWMSSLLSSPTPTRFARQLARSAYLARHSTALLKLLTEVTRFTRAKKTKAGRQVSSAVIQKRRPSLSRGVTGREVGSRTLDLEPPSSTTAALTMMMINSSSSSSSGGGPPHRRPPSSSFHKGVGAMASGRNEPKLDLNGPRARLNRPLPEDEDKHHDENGLRRRPPPPPPPHPLPPISVARRTKTPTTITSIPQQQEPSWRPSKPVGCDGAVGIEPDARLELKRLFPRAELSVELPGQGNGNMFQVRTTISEEIFIGRGGSREEAVLKCCKKAVKFIGQYWDPSENRALAPHERRKNVASSTTSPPSSTASSRSSSILNSQRHDWGRFERGNGGGGSTAERRQPPFQRDEAHSRGDDVRHRDRYYYPPAEKDPYYVDHDLDESKGRRDSVRNERHRPTRRDDGPRRKSDDRDIPSWGERKFSANEEKGATANVAEHAERKGGNDSKERPPPPSIVVTSEDCEDEYCEYIEEKLKPNVPIKNAVMMLNELFPPPKAPQYKVTSQTGPPNNPTFTMVCTINAKSFNGEGKSKKEAKLSCSQKAIEVLYGYKISETKSVPERSNPRANCDLDDWMELEGKNPVSILNELYPGIQYQLVSTTGPSHAPQFVIKASLNDMSFEGSGKSKKDAKLNASKALLVHLHKVGFDPMTGDMMSTQLNNNEVAEGHSFADQIGQLVSAKYQTLFGTTTYSKRRVMSGIVMTRDGSVQSSGEVICVSSGTKCINGEQLSLEGCVINDSHAEIVSRRCLVVFLYTHLEMLADPAPEKALESIFERCAGHEAGYQLKKGVEFHLFITTSPCGDARIFSLHESPSSNSLSNLCTNSNNSSIPPRSIAREKKDPEDDLLFDKDPTTDISTKKSPVDGFDCTAISSADKEREEKKLQDSSRGMLRSKIECGMGTVPINPKLLIQTWDGVMSGDRLLTMACSDKILRWNVLGIQGALLTHLVKPIYLNSITVGSKFHPGHMKRALYERITPHIATLPSRYSVNVPDLYATTSPETRQATKAHDYSVNWILDMGQPEIVNGSTGKTINDNISRLSKKCLFTRFLEASAHLMNSPFTSPVRYSEVKQKARDYQSAKTQLNGALIEAGCGHWIEKPIEQDQFSL